MVEQGCLAFQQAVTRPFLVDYKICFGINGPTLVVLVDFCSLSHDHKLILP